ncbi:MAG: hypothetical protein DIZ80_10820 [endosymbiont of Galathealinum brachiosum]|uniref:Uncharacterized protein n=1 Tax=endosymbiont of Galathealinum brachiosum TaxID=2200906 RepID=A0A370DDV8_9GAMM|nr:MAG: hypothetical protein DIZ80_10820 [endosymbiont of Galathealinum brachiosum]
MFAYFLMPACSLLHKTPESLDHDLKQWLTQNEYDEIDNALQNIDKNDKAFKSILDKTETIVVNKNQFIEKTSVNAQKLKSSNDWQQALNVYDDALEKIQDEPRLTHERSNLLRERDEQITALKKDMLMKRAHSLISYRKIYDKLHKLIPYDYNAQFDIDRYNADRTDVASHLKRCGDQARKNMQYEIARDCYALSDNLAPSKQKQLWLSKINAQLKDKSIKKRQKELLDLYEVTYNKHEYNKAQSHLSALLTVTPSHEKAKALLSTLNSEISKLVANKISSGKTLYSENKIDDALKIWQQAAQLEPENKELIQLINRAKKVSLKIQSLEKTQ